MTMGPESNANSALFFFEERTGLPKMVHGLGFETGGHSSSTMRYTDAYSSTVS
jgi:hypothetical protein